MIPIVYLTITSWYGVGFGAVHYYGTLYFKNKRYDLSYKLNKNQIKLLNLNDGYHYRVGQKSERFWSSNEVLKNGKNIWKEIFPKAKILVLGRTGVVQPQKVLAGDDKLKSKINRLFDKAEKIDFWKDENKMVKICDTWEKLVKFK